MVAVASTSYHGPPSTSFGSKTPLWTKTYQVKYPSPVAGEEVVIADFVQRFEQWLDKHGEEVGVMLIEPQWGSMQCALPWPKELLKTYVKMAQGRGIKVISDEIMCGIGRHGMGTMFVAEAWELDVDAITFGKAISAGVFPLSGAILKTGRDILSGAGRSVMQSHTFAGANARSLITGAMVLNELPKWFDSISKLGQEMTHIFRALEKESKGMIICHGQGLMWGGLFTKTDQNTDENYRAESVQCFKKNCDDVGVLPYHTPVGGFMVSPVVDIDVGTVYEFGEKLQEAVRRTVEDRGWNDVTIKREEVISLQEHFAEFASTVKCDPSLHLTRSCTSCNSFVCQDTRMKFVTN
jgi:adenosylmethionine-8-amino-7-oxononanoate aminotransferase